MIAARLFNKTMNYSFPVRYISQLNNKFANTKWQQIRCLHNFNQNNVLINNSGFPNTIGWRQPHYCFGSSKISQKQVNESSYDELVAKLAKLYNFQQYKIPSTLSLLQIHHQYNIFKPGDWVLDVGAGPNWSWTELALKLTHSPNASQRVISCDVLQYKGRERLNNIIVTGDFSDEPVQTKIAMNLINNQLSTILIDATPEYSGNQQMDASQTMSIFVEALKFSKNYLKKGGNIVFKTIESAATLQNQEQAKFFFNEVYRYRSPSFRIDSPAFFYVLKGFMMTDNLTGADNFLKQYLKAKSSFTKIQIVQKYRQMYKWNPIKVVNNEAKNRAMTLKEQGRKNKQIAAMFQNDPYVKIGEILKLIDNINDKTLGVLEREDARRKLLNQKDGMIFPKNKEQFAEMLFTQAQKVQQQIQQQQKEKKRKKSKGKVKNKQKIQDRAPLSENEVYLKTPKVKDSGNQPDLQQKQYRPEDLYGFHPADCYKSINNKLEKTYQLEIQQNQAQLEKILKSFPEVKEAFQSNRNKNFDDQFKQFQQKIDKQFSVKKDEQGFMKIKRKGGQVDNDQQSEDQQDFTTNKTELKIKNRVRNVRKVGEQSEFNFENQDPQVIQQKQQEQFKKRQSLELQKQSKIQYLKSRPKKNKRETNQNISKRQTQKSYFKVKDKNKGKDKF